MLRKKYLYGIDGEISQIFPNDRAEIQFDLDGVQEYALLMKNRFYHNGRPIPENVQLSKFIRANTKVKFSCHVLDRLEQDPLGTHHYYRSYSWYAMMCWINDQDSSNNKVAVTMGLFCISCSIESVGNRHGVITMIDNMDNEHRIEFLASKFYLQAKRFPSSKMLSSVLSPDDKIFCDAVPCIEEESRDNCRWFATCAFQGKRPRLAQPLDMFNDFCANYLVQPNQKSLDQQKPLVDDDETHDDRFNPYVQQTQAKSNFKSQLLKVINLHTSDPRALFTSGYGFVLDVLNDEFAILLGSFKLNIFQTILFHRRNAFLFKSSLAGSKLTEIFVEGDYLRFIAVAAPPNFVTDWIAVQVSVAEFLPEIEDSSAA